MIITVIFLVLTLVTAVVLCILLIMAILCFVGVAMKKQEGRRIPRLKKIAMLLAVLITINIGLVTVTQLTSFTPRIVDDNGNTPQNSIAELTEVTLNGRKQWISLRGWDINKPILLFLAGGPGGTQMAAVRHELSELEKHFVVVNWDQPGAGKSYYAEKTKNITPETYINDGYALTEYLKERFSQEKIYLVGESWGSALGIFLIDRHPESYHAFIGTAQMVAFSETERVDYAKAIEIAKEKGDANILKQLKENGTPPYYGNNVTWKSAVYMNYLSKYMTNNPEIQNPGYSTPRDIGSSEYGIIDKINYARGIIDTYNQVYQQLYDIDMREDYTQLDVPVYFFMGRHDVNAPTVFVEEYMDVLDAPEKQIVWFEHSGHSPWINERDKFVKELLKYFSEEEDIK
ncbi:MAG: alpha/beta fold hydrolase [Eubacteriales bacterium]